MTKLAVWATVWESLFSPFGHAARLVKIFGVAFVLYMIVAGLYIVSMRDFFALYAEMASDPASFDPVLLQTALADKAGLIVLFMIGQTLIIIPPAVRWNRLIVLGPDATIGDSAFSFGPREMGFLGRYILLALIALGLVLILMIGMFFIALALGAAGGGEALIFIFVMAGYIVIAYVGLRLSLILPARSIDQSIRLNDAWRVTRGNGLRLLVASIIVAVTVVVLYLALSLLVVAIGMNAMMDSNPFALTVTGIVTTVITFFYLAAFAALPAIAYRRLAFSPDGRPTPDIDEEFD